jgi:hypothetical protein
MTDIQFFHFQKCAVRYFPAAEYLETIFEDGEKCPALFTFKSADAEKALALGYTSYEKVRTDGLCTAIRQMHLEHELAHTFIAEALGEPYCPVLRSVAVKGPCEGAWERESLVVDWQRYMNGAAASEQLIQTLGIDAVVCGMIDFCRRFRK